jgi:hypothetical protein
MKFNFTETKEIEFDIDFQKVYDYVKKELESDPDYHPTRWDIHTNFGDNMDYYLKNIYGYVIEDNESNGFTMDYIFEEWGNWIQTNKIDE